MSKRDDDVEFVEEAGAESAEKTTNVKKLKEDLKACKAERQEYLDGWQRAKADFINTKKRLEEEGERKFEHGTYACIEKLLPALDSLDIALSQKEDDGLKLIQKQIFEALKIESFDPVGDTFDPNLHEPMGTVETDKKEEDDIVTQTLQKGYKRGEKIIRPAKVQIATFNT